MIRVLLLSLVVGLPAWAAEWKVSSPSEITFYVHHPMHEVVSVSKQAKGTLKFAWPTSDSADFSGLVKQFVQADWKHFDSDNGSRDGNIRNFVDAAKYPTITFLVTEVGSAVATANGYDVPLKGRLYVKGTKKVVDTTARFEKVGDTELRVRAHIESKLTDHAIEPPSLLFVKTKDPFEIDIDLRLQQ